MKKLLLIAILILSGCEKYHYTAKSMKCYGPEHSNITVRCEEVREKFTNADLCIRAAKATNGICEDRKGTIIIQDTSEHIYYMSVRR